MAGKLEELIVSKTKEGPVEFWLSRIAALVEPVINTANVNWNQSPNLVASSIVSEMRRSGSIERLQRLLETVQ